MSIMSISLNSASSDTVSLTSRRTISTSKHWAAIFDERIYQICNVVHPGLPIDFDAVEHIRNFLQSIVFELIEARATSVVEVDKAAKKLFGYGLNSVCKDAWDNMHQQLQKHKYQKILKTALDSQHRLALVIKETLGPREKEKKDREKKEIERIVCYVYYACESVTEDVLRLTGNYVKNIRNSEQKITMANLDVALNADRALMELRTKLRNEEEAESPGGFGFLAEFEEFVAEETEHSDKATTASQTYESVAVDFLRDERRFIRELNRINVFRRRIESVAVSESDKLIASNLFGNLTEIHDLALKIVRILEDAIELNDTQCIGMGIWEYGEAYEFDTYTFYIRRDGELNESRHATYVIYDNIKALLENERFAPLFQSGDHYCGSSLDGQSFRLAVQYVLPQLLHIPIFHIYQYHEYINRLHQLSCSEEDRRDLNDCRSAFERVVGSVSDIPTELKTKIAQFLDQQAKSEKIYNVKRLNEIQSSIDGFTGSPIGKTCNELEKDGDLGMIRPSLQLSNEITKNKRWKTERFVYVFDQMIVLCKRHKNSLKFKDRLAVHSIDVFDVSDAEVTNCFRIESRDKNCFPKTYHFVCRNPEEKRQWMAVLVKVTTKSVLDRILDNYEKEEAKRIPLIVPGPDQYRFSEPDTEDNITFEDYTSSSGIPVIKCGTVLKLIERLTYHSYTDSKYIQTFLISYRSFCTPNDLFSLLLERFNIPTPKKLQQPKQGGGPLAGRYDTVQSHGLSTISSSSGINPLYEQKFRKEFQQPIQLRVLSVLNQWVKQHWYDFQCDPGLLDALELFLNRCCDPREGLTKQHKKFCKTILALIEKRVKNPPGIMQPPTENGEKIEGDEGHVNSAFVFGDDQHQPQAQVYTNESPNDQFLSKRPEILWHTAQKGDFEHYDLLTLHPLEIGRQLTLLHFDLYRAIQPIELVEAAWTKSEKWRKSPQLLRLTDHSTLLTYWVSKSIVETESLEERMAMFNRVLEVMSVFEELHNFTGLVAFYSALNSSCIFRLKWCWERLDSEKQKCFDRFNTLCERRWHEMQKRLSSINPPCIPFFGHYLSNIYFLEQGNSTFVNKSPGAQKQKDDVKPSDSENRQFKQLVSFLKCRKISDVIREIQIYQNERYSLTLEPTIRQFFETINPKNDFKSNEDLEEYLYQKSLEIQPKGLDAPVSEVKPKHNASTLRSPGIKPPKVGNHYSANHPVGLLIHSQHTHSAPQTMCSSSHQSSTVPNTPISVHETKRSMSQNHDDGHVAMVDVRFDRKGTQRKIPALQPPPLLPRSRSNAQSNASLPPTTQAPMPPAPKSSGMMSTASSPTSISTTPSSSVGPAPKLHPRRMPPPMSPLAKSPLTPSKDNSPSAFQFPVVYEVAPPPLPPRPSAPSDASISSPSTSATKENQEQLRVIFDREDSHSPTVRLSVPLPPALPPPRGSTVFRAPPPLPPKSGRHNNSSPTSSSDPFDDPTSPSIFVNTPPPPLPPKTYRSTRK